MQTQSNMFCDILYLICIFRRPVVNEDGDISLEYSHGTKYSDNKELILINQLINQYENIKILAEVPDVECGIRK